jgi:hypothetical protein
MSWSRTSLASIRGLQVTFFEVRVRNLPIDEQNSLVAGASIAILNGSPTNDTHSHTIQLLTSGQLDYIEPFGSDMSVSGWSLPPVPLYFIAGLDPTQEYTIVLSNKDASRSDCPGYFGRCSTQIDSLILAGGTVEQ